MKADQVKREVYKLATRLLLENDGSGIDCTEVQYSKARDSLLKSFAIKSEYRPHAKGEPTPIV